MKKRTVKPFYGKREQRMEARARLMAQAPKLLDEAKAICKAIGKRIVSRRKAAGWVA